MSLIHLYPLRVRLLSILFLLATTSLQAASPNVLFISVDDWNDWIGAYGGDHQAKTPNLDRLAKRGVSFRNAHTSAVYCAPSRTSLMTGMNPSTSGCYSDEPHFAPQNDPEIKDIAMWFRDNGYYVNGGGKLYHHMPGFIDMRGWDDYFIWDAEHKKDGWRLNAWHGDNAPLPDKLPCSEMAEYLLKNSKHKTNNRVNSHMEWGPLNNGDEEKMADTICANWAANFLRSKAAPEGKPFFLGFGLYAPHKPNFVPQKYFDMYPLSELETPRMHKGDLDDLPINLKARQLKKKQRIDQPLRKLKEGKKAVQGYLAALSYADAMVGRVLDALAESPYADNTIIVLWSDNGYHLGEKGHWAKHTLWERTSNVPFIWAGPGIAKGEVVDTTASLLDTYPTLIELCGLPKNNTLEGKSLATTLKSPAKAKDRTVLQTDFDSYAVINQTWRYVLHSDGEEELYQVSVDPQEHNNLSAVPKYRQQMDQLAKSIPTDPAPQGKTPRDLKLKVDGDKFHWTERKPKK